MTATTTVLPRRESWRRTLDMVLHPYETEVERLDRAWAVGQITDAEYDGRMLETGRRFQRALMGLASEGLV